MKRYVSLKHPSGGFTIIELLVATLVFSVVLVLITLGVLSFNRSYYRGLTQSNTQNTARLIIDNIAQSIQFSGDQITAPIGTAGSGSSVGFCVGNQRYSYILGWELTDGAPNALKHQTSHALMLDTPGSCSGLNAQNVQLSPGGSELLAPSMRVAKLSVTPVAGATNLYNITIRLVYGDDDLLYSPSGISPAATAPDANCRTGQSGSQFCAASELSTIAQKRIN